MEGCFRVLSAVCCSVAWRGGRQSCVRLYLTEPGGLLTGRFLFLLGINISRYRNSFGI